MTENVELFAGIASVVACQLVIVAIAVIKHKEDLDLVMKGEGHIPYDKDQSLNNPFLVDNMTLHEKAQAGLAKIEDVLLPEQRDINKEYVRGKKMSKKEKSSAKQELRSKSESGDKQTSHTKKKRWY